MSSFYRRLYRLVTDASPSDAVDSGDLLEKNAPANFFRLLIARTLSKVGDRLASPKTTLAWLLQALGAPAFFTGLIVPLRESGSLLPQIILSNFLKRYRVRKWAWSFGAVLQGVAMAGCGLVALTLTGAAAGYSIVGLVAVFALARGVGSVSAKDVLGKTIPKSKRGQLTGWAGAISGVIAILAAGFLFLGERGGGSQQTYAMYLGVAAVLWILAAIANARVSETEGEASSKVSLGKGLGSQFKLLRTDRKFRDFLLVRALAVGSGLATPYLIALAHDQLGGAAFWLGVFIVAEGVAAMVASPVWGRLADRSSRGVLRAAMFLVSGLLVGVISYVSLADDGAGAWFVFPLALFLLGIAHSGVRIGRKTYVVDMAEGNQRTDYVAVGNTLIGLLLLIAGVFTGLVSLLSVELAIGTFAVLAFCGALYGNRLPAASGKGE